MVEKTCLLITDDPDDHFAFSEAIAEISDKAIVLIVLDSHKALQFLISKKTLPDYLFLDLSMHGIRVNTFLKGMKADQDLARTPIMAYGEERDFKKVDNPDGLVFFRKDFEYTDLRDFLKNYLTAPKRH